MNIEYRKFLFPLFHEYAIGIRGYEHFIYRSLQVGAPWRRTNWFMMSWEAYKRIHKNQESSKLEILVVCGACPSDEEIIKLIGTDQCA